MDYGIQVELKQIATDFNIEISLLIVYSNTDPWIYQTYKPIKTSIICYFMMLETLHKIKPFLLCYIVH